MFTEKQMVVLNTLLNHYVFMRALYESARWAFNAEPGDEGIVAFLDAERSERAEEYVKIGEFLNSHQGKVLLSEVEAPPHMVASADTINRLALAEKETVETLQSYLQEVGSAENAFTAFLRNLHYKAVKEKKEVEAIASQISAVANMPNRDYEMRIMNQYLMQEYGYEEEMY